MARNGGKMTRRPSTLWARETVARRSVLLAAGAAGVLAIGLLDYATGIELRVFALYYLPVGGVAWHLGRWGSIPLGLLSTATWVLANSLGGLTYSDARIWVVNAAMQGISFLLVGGLVAMLRERVVAEESDAATDPLTGLANRRAFYEVGQRHIDRCRRTGTPATLAYIDLDRFKVLNDTVGHAAGDELLRGVANCITMAVRPGDLVARLGGDEFAILLPEAGDRAAEGVLERVRRAVEGQCSHEAVAVTATLGAATYAVPPAEIEAMVQRADAAMYAAKHAGRNRVHIEPEPAR